MTTSGQSQPFSLNSIHITICYILQGGLQRQIEAISNEKTIQLLNATVESPVMEFLPSIVRDFSLISNNEGFEDNLETSYIKGQLISKCPLDILKSTKNQGFLP